MYTVNTEYEQRGETKDLKSIGEAKILFTHNVMCKGVKSCTLRQVGSVIAHYDSNSFVVGDTE